MNRFSRPLLLLLLLLPAIAAGAETVPSSLLARFFEDKLTHPYVMVRIEGIGGLGRLGESGAVAELTDLAERTSGFERLLALWALARIGTPEALDTAAPEGGQALRPGESFHERAARTALIAALKSDEAPGIFDPVLPELYTKARRGRTEEKLLAAWALYEIGTPVTAATADEAMKAVAEELDPGHGNYTRHLNYLRLAGPRGGGIVAPKLKTLFLSHPFEPGLTPKKALTGFTLAFIAYPDDPPLVSDFRGELELDLDRSLYDFTALKDLRALGPFACTPGMIEKLREKAARERDEEERELAEENLRMCGG